MNSKEHNRILASVLGLDVQYDTLYDMMVLSTNICSSEFDCNTTNCKDNVSKSKFLTSLFN